jgi:hypothetical protein
MADGSVRFQSNVAGTSTGNHRPTQKKHKKTYSTAERLLRPNLYADVQTDNQGRIVAAWVPTPWRWDEPMVVKNDDIQRIATWVELEALFVYGQTEFSDRELSQLAELRNLRVLSFFSRKPISAEGFRQLRVLSKLKVLRVSYPGATEEAGSALKSALPNCEVMVRDSSSK